MNLGKLSLSEITEVKIDRYMADGRMPVSSPDRVITDGYGRIYQFKKYANYNQDSKPKVLILGHWRPKKSRKDLMGGINLNYLDDGDIKKLRQALKVILKGKNLKERYWIGRKVLPAIFKAYYRTYDKDYITAVTPSSLKFLDTDVERRQKEKEKAAKLLRAKKAKQLDAAAKKGKAPERDIPEPEDDALHDIDVGGDNERQHEDDYDLGEPGVASVANQELGLDDTDKPERQELGLADDDEEAVEPEGLDSEAIDADQELEDELTLDPEAHDLEDELSLRDKI